MMKQLAITVILCFAGMTIFAQDMSYYTNEFKRLDGTFEERLIILESVRDSGVTGFGDFYYEALKYFLLKTPDIRTIDERSSAEQSARILCEALGAEKYTDAAPELWQTVQFYDVARTGNDGLAMQEALIALGQVNGTDFLPQIVNRLDSFNSQTFSNAEARRFAQRGVVGCVNALEALKEADGYRPVFFVSVGSYDPSIQQIAENALPNILDDPVDVLTEIISDLSISPPIKLEAWNKMMSSNAPNTSKAKAASAALTTSFSYITSNRSWQTNLKTLRKNAIDAVLTFGVADDSVYENLEKTYSTNFVNRSPDYDEIDKTIITLAGLKTDESVGMLQKFLQELNGRRRSGPWGQKERNLFERVVYYIGTTGTSSTDVRILLTTIQRSSDYTSAEQRMAANALSSLSN